MDALLHRQRNQFDAGLRNHGWRTEQTRDTHEWRSVKDMKEKALPPRQARRLPHRPINKTLSLS
jgi:hypothetical protein